MDTNKYCFTGAVGTTTIMGTAASKAPQDVCGILRKNGYQNLYVTVRQDDSAFKRLIIKFIQLRKLFKSVPRGSTVLIQYPIYKFLFLPLIYLKGCKKRVLIHDLDSIRDKGKLNWVERQNLKSFDEIIVHTDEMKSLLSTFFKGKIYVLKCFDYLLQSDNNYTSKRKLEKSICFAGNINKSKYIASLIKNNPSVEFFLYGSMDVSLSFEGNYLYEGKFHPDKIGFLKGSWGLVWDGLSIESCSGTWGEYLKFIASHKVSLYIVAGLPLIVWSKSAMSKFVKENGLGIIVDSLNDLDKTISEVTISEYQLYLQNIEKLAPKLINGEMLGAVLNKMQ